MKVDSGQFPRNKGTAAQFNAKRRSVRRYMVDELSRKEEDFDWEFNSLSDRTPLDVLADAIAIACLITDLVNEAGADVDITSFVPGYTEDACFREYIDVYVRNYWRSTPDNIEYHSNRLVSFALKNAGPTRMTISGPLPGGPEWIHPIRQAATVLGGITKAATLIGVTAATLTGWANGGGVSHPEKVDWLYRLAGMTFNRYRRAVRIEYGTAMPSGVEEDDDGRFGLEDEEEE